MPILSLKGAKGGVGTSLVAANLAVMLAGSDRCLLMDLTPAAGGLDLLLGMEPAKSWADLLPVANELTERHLDIAATTGIDGLTLLAAPPQPVHEDPTSLIDALSSRFHWLLLDLGHQAQRWQSGLLSKSDNVLLVSTLDPPALRAGERWLAAWPDDVRSSTQLVVNQWARKHPVDPKSLAESLEIELATVIPYSPREVSDQINYGRPIASKSRAGYSRAISRLARGVRERNPAVDRPVAGD